MPSGHDPLLVESLVSPERFRRYREAAGGDGYQAAALYEWGTRLSAACFEAFHYVEVIVRNAMDRELSAHFKEETGRIPWFLLPVGDKSQARIRENIERVRTRLRAQGPSRETRGQILAGVDFGFWVALLHTEHEQLWRDALRKSFPHSSGRRKDVAPELERLRLLRNKLAHHDSLLAVDVRFELGRMLQVLAWVDPAAESWLASVERISTVVSARPLALRDTVIVGARQAWPLYEAVGAYVCQPGRTFQSVDHLAFYADREIKPEIPSVLRRIDNVEWSHSEAARLRASADPGDQRLAEIITESRAQGWVEGRYQLFDLTRPGAEGHLTLAAPVPHLARGRGSAFVQGQRYANRDAIAKATSTAQLI